MAAKDPLNLLKKSRGKPGSGAKKDAAAAKKLLAQLKKVQQVGKTAKKELQDESDDV